jgi:DNA-directed RNA polymerase specialized sigma24 family protein
LSIPIGTVTSRLYRARENLRFFMHDHQNGKVVKLK